jgi:hypothetical protein
MSAENPQNEEEIVLCLVESFFFSNKKKMRIRSKAHQQLSRMAVP